MFKKLFLFMLLLPSMLFGVLEYRVENTNITLLSDNNTSLYNYDRLRFRVDYTNDNLFGTFIGDMVNYLGDDYVNSEIFSYIKSVKSDTPYKTQTGFKDYSGGSVYAKVYRVYGGYEDGKNRILVGLQNITMGVGRIWTPTNLFNPKNSYAIESAEVFGVMALLYTRHLDETSDITIVTSQDSDNKLQYGARYKAYLSFADFALDFIVSDDIKMLGYEFEANLAKTGVELRSEGTYIKSRLSSLGEEEFFQGILGADYGFENGVSVILEGLYSSKKFSYSEVMDNFDTKISSNLVYSNLYLASSLSYEFNIFLSVSLLYIESFNEQNSRFISPGINYSFGDYNSFSFGAMLYDGVKKSEFGIRDNNYFFEYILSF